MCPGKQLVDLAVRMAIDDPGEDVGEVGNRVDVVQLAGFDQRRDSGPMLGATVGARKQCIFPVERDRTDRAFDGIAWTMAAIVFASAPRLARIVTPSTSTSIIPTSGSDLHRGALRRRRSAGTDAPTSTTAGTNCNSSASECLAAASLS